MPYKVTDEELDRLVKILTTTRLLKLGHPKKLTEGRYLMHAHARSIKSNEKWSLSIYQTAINPENDVELAIDHPPFAWPSDDPKRSKDVLQWLEAQRYLEHKPSGNHDPQKREFFRLGMTYDGAKKFLHLLSEQLTIPQENQRWAVNVAPTHPPSAVDQTVERMLKTVLQTCAQSGQVSQQVAKEKLFQFDSEDHFKRTLKELLDKSDLRCALTGIPLSPSVSESDLAPSLDRIDSTGHYQPGNVQIVARFANRWKSADSDEHFKTLLELVRSHR